MTFGNFDCQLSYSHTSQLMVTYLLTYGVASIYIPFVLNLYLAVITF